MRQRSFQGYWVTDMLYINNVLPCLCKLLITFTCSPGDQHGVVMWYYMYNTATALLTWGNNAVQRIKPCKLPDSIVDYGNP